MLLAIDTSTRLIGLACYDDVGLVGECAWQGGNNQTSQLLPQLQMLLRHLGKDQGALRAISVALGPGSWSGLRVGISVAKGLALANELPLLGICTLDVLAYQHQRPATPVHPLIHLGRDRYGTAEFQHRGQWKRLSEYRNVTLNELCDGIADKALFCGDIGAEVQEHLRQHMGERARFPHPAANLRRPGYLAELAWQRLSEGSVDDVATLEPIYLGSAVQGR